MPIIGYRNKFVTGQITDSGISSASPSDNFRTMRDDGTFNAITVDSSAKTFSDFYIRLVRIPMPKFFGLFFCFLLFMNLIFTGLFFLIGDNYIIGLPGDTLFHRFAKVFLFSIQSMTTSGFGLSSTSGKITLIAGIEVVFGLLIFAVVTGLIYGRFSQATARLVHSNKALISPYRGGRALTFRVGNARTNQLVNIDWIVTVAFNQQVGEKVIRRYMQLNLESTKGIFFPIAWTVVHPIDENSPLFHFTEQDFKDGSLELLVVINGFDETFNQMVHTRFGYGYKDIIWRAKFDVNFEHHPDGIIRHHLKRISDFHPEELPDEK